MNIFIILVIALVGGIIYFNAQSPVNTKTRDAFLKSLEKFLEGTLEPIPGRENAWRIRFNFEGQDFVYEDLEGRGFYGKIYKSFLRTTAKSNLTLKFEERRHLKLINKDVMLSTDMIYDPNQAKIKLELSKELSQFNVITNDPLQANKVLKEPKITKIFTEFKNMDPRGHPFMALNIEEGEICLEFHPSGTFNPRPLIRHQNMQSLEDYLDKMMAFVRIMKYT